MRASFGFLGWAESDHILRARGRNELDDFVVGFVWLHGLTLSWSLALLLIQCTNPAAVVASVLSVLNASSAAAALKPT